MDEPAAIGPTGCNQMADRTDVLILCNSLKDLWSILDFTAYLLSHVVPKLRRSRAHKACASGTPVPEVLWELSLKLRLPSASELKFPVEEGFTWTNLGCADLASAVRRVGMFSCHVGLPNILLRIVRSAKLDKDGLDHDALDDVALALNVLIELATHPLLIPSCFGPAFVREVERFFSAARKVKPRLLVQVLGRGICETALAGVDAVATAIAQWPRIGKLPEKIHMQSVFRNVTEGHLGPDDAGRTKFIASVKRDLLPLWVQFATNDAYKTDPDPCKKQLQTSVKLLASFLEDPADNWRTRFELDRACRANNPGMAEFWAELGKRNACAACNASAAKKKCSGCLHVSYCNRECQVAHWKEHKKVCKKK